MPAWSDCEVLVTGARRGIGHAVASALRQCGANVSITQTQQHPTSFHSYAWRMENPESTRALIDQLKHDDRVPNILIHCAHSFTPTAPILSTKGADFATSLVTNTQGIFELTKFCARRINRKGFGRVLYIGSMIAKTGGKGKVRYIVEKSALEGMIKAFAAEFDRGDIRFDILHPAIVDTENVRSRIAPELLEKVSTSSSMGRLISVEEVARSVLEAVDPTLQTESGRSITLTGGLDLSVTEAL